MRLISDKKSEQKPLEVPDEIYHTIINNILDTIVEIDLNGNFTYVSPQCYQMFGFNPHEVIGRKALRFVHPDDLLHVMNKMKTAIEDQKHISYEYRAKHKNGGYIHVSAKGGITKHKGITKIIAVIRDITEKKIAEVKLKESEKEYRNIIENTKDAIVIIDFEGKLLYISPQLSKMLKGREVTKNSRFFHYIHKDDVKKLISFYKTTLEEKSFLEQPVEFRILPKQGDYIWVSSSSKNYYDDFGNVIGFISTLKDITDKNLAEQKLKESEQKYRLITEQSNDLIRVLNEKFELEYVNELSLKSLLGYTKQELLGKNSIILNHPDDYKKVRRFMLKVFKYGENMHETRIRHKNGKWVWFENKAKMFTDEQGNKKYLYISRDITERKKTEKALKESEEKYRSLYENSPNAVVLSDKNGIILDMNSSAERILGYNRNEMIGRNYIDFNIVTYDQISTIKRMYKNLLNGNKPKSIELQIKRNYN
jgi:PAS domain S-box-containing protein